VTREEPGEEKGAKWFLLSTARCYPERGIASRLSVRLYVRDVEVS